MIVACRFQTHGPAQVISTGCTSGIDAIGYAHQVIQDGEADVIIVSMSELSPISPITLASFDAIKATSPENDDPEHASRPFDADRKGFILGEGCAVLILEELNHARARGARIYCELAGYATRGNAFHMTGLRPDGAEMAESILDAMAQARLNPGDLHYISAHGSGTKQNDRHETAAFKRTLGQAAYGIPISSIKSMIGHSLGAIGAIEMATCALAMATSVVPPTANWATRDPECDLDYTPNTARERPVDAVLSRRQRPRWFPVSHGVRPAREADMTSRRAVVTGIGIVAPSGTSTEAHWKTVLSGESKIGPITAFDPEPYETRLAGEVTGFDPADHAEGRLIVQTDRWTWLAFAAANAAFEDAALDPASLDPYSISVALASSSGGNQFGQG